MKRVTVLAVISVLLAACGFSSTTAQKTESGPIKIAGVYSLTGAFSTVGIPGSKAAQVAVQYVNAHGGINGRKLDITLFDDQSRPEQGVVVAQQIAADPSFLGVVGAVNTTVGPPETTAFNNSSVPIVATFGDPSVDTDVGHWTFKQSPSFDIYSLAAMPFIHDKLGVTKIGLLYEVGTYGQSFLNVMKAQGSQFGVSLVDAEAIQPNPVDVTPAIGRIVQSGAQVLFLATTTNIHVALLNWATLGYPIPALAQIGYSNPAQIKPAEEAGKHLSGIIAYFTGDDPLPRQKPLVDAYQKAYGETAQFNNAQSWDAVQILTKALKTDSSSRAKVRDSLEKVKDLQGAGGIYTFTASRHIGFQAGGIEFLKYDGNGHYSVVK